MDLTITEEQEGLTTSVREVLAAECPPSVTRAMVESGQAPTALWGRMCELGWPALAVPEDCGGLGYGTVELALVAMEHGRAIAPGPFLATTSQFAAAVAQAGDPEQRKRFLSPVASGQTTGTLAVAEATGSWRPEHVAATARRDAGEWVLSGEKHYVMDGASADEVVVAARRDDGALGLFVVPGESVTASSPKSYDPSRAVAGLVLDSVRVDDGRCLGGDDDAGPALGRVLEVATVCLSAEMVGTCQAIFDLTLDHAKVREQFGVPIGSFQAIKHKFADMLIALERARAAFLYAALTISEDAPQRSQAASMAKAAASDCQRLLCKEGIQIHGGIGYTWEHDVHLFVKRAKSADALLGNGTVHRRRVADLLDV